MSTSTSSIADGGGGDWLADWLHTLNLSEYYQVFAGQGLTTLDRVQGIDKAQLNSIGITKLGHVNRLCKAAEKLNSTCSNTSSNGHPSHNPATACSGTICSVRRKTGELTSSMSAPQLKKPPPVPMRRSLRRTPSPASHQKPFTLQESSTSPSTSPASSSRSSTPSPLPPEVTPRGSSLHPQLGLRYSDSTVIELRRRSSPELQLPIHIEPPPNIPPGVTQTTLPAGEHPVPAPRRLLSSPIKARKYYENIGTPRPLQTAPSEVVPPTHKGSIQPPPPPRRSSSIKPSTAKEESSEKTTTPSSSTLSSSIIPEEPHDVTPAPKDPCLTVSQPPAIPPKILEENGPLPSLPPKDVSLSELPAPIQPRVSSLEALKKRDTASSSQLLQTCSAASPDMPSPPLLPQDTESPSLHPASFATKDNLPPRPTEKESSVAHKEIDSTSVLKDTPVDQPPSLPPKTNSLPSFRPPTPPSSSDDEDSDLEVEEEEEKEEEEEEEEEEPTPVPPPMDPSPPALPPKAPSMISLSPPPAEVSSDEHFPPPIPPRDFPQLPPAPPIPTEFSDSEDDEDSFDEDRPKLVIMSLRRGSSSILPVSVASNNSTVTTPTSPDSPLSSTSSDMELKVIQQQFTSAPSDEKIEFMSQPTLYTKEMPSVVLRADPMPQYEEVALEPTPVSGREQAQGNPAVSGQTQYEEVQLLSDEGQQHYDEVEVPSSTDPEVLSYEPMTSPEHASQMQYKGFQVSFDTGQEHYEEVAMGSSAGSTQLSYEPKTTPAFFHHAPFGQTSSPSRPILYDEVELRDPLSTSAESVPRHPMLRDDEYIFSTDGSSSQREVEDTYSTIADTEKPSPSPAFAKQSNQMDSADIYSTIPENEGSPRNAEDGLRGQRSPSASSTMPTQQQQKKVMDNIIIILNLKTVILSWL